MKSLHLPRSADVVVIGAGVVGASTALALTRSGLKVVVVDRGSVASGTTGAGEGNILVSDKEPGAELELALRSRDLWFEIASDIGNNFELEAKGGVVVARKDPAPLFDFAKKQEQAGIKIEFSNHKRLHELEPHLAPSIENGVFYPQDAQCQPMLAAAHMLRAVRESGGVIFNQADVKEIRSRHGKVTTVVTSRGVIDTPIVVNATGTWAGEVAALAGSNIPVMPRRGFILVTEKVPQLIFHKVYDSDYVDNVASGDADLQTSTVVEGTQSGTILIGASRERIGFETTMNIQILRKLAAQATSLFPILRDIQLLRAYRGFRPYAPDHLPIIGEDSHVQGLWHSAGHEGAGIGLAPGSARLLADLITGKSSFMDARPFSPQRFQVGA